MSAVLLVQANSLQIPLRDDSVQACVTSPPYLWQRDYGIAGQLGLEATLTEYLANMVTVFREVKRCLREDGTLWLNVGDKMVNKQLLGVPWKLAFALQEDGWYLRSDVVWSKKNCLPESVQDRCVKSHEYVFMLSKSPHYFFDADAIREEASANSHGSPHINPGTKQEALGQQEGGRLGRWTAEDRLRGRLPRSVWHLASEPTSFAHFATFPQALVTKCVLAGTPQAGSCSTCGKPYERQVERTDMPATSHKGSYFDRGKTGVNGQGRVQSGERYLTQATGFRPACPCEPAASRPAIVLDPFSGSGTTVLTARALGRHGIGIDLSLPYLHLSRDRLGLTALDAWHGKETPVSVETYDDLPMFATREEK